MPDPSDLELDGIGGASGLREGHSHGFIHAASYTIPGAIIGEAGIARQPRRPQMARSVSAVN
jgi:hypothetical protein